MSDSLALMPRRRRKGIVPREGLLAVKLRSHRSKGEVGSEGEIEREASGRAAGSA